MSGSSHRAPVGWSYRTKHISSDDKKKPVQFQISASKRLPLVQYSDDDSAESTSEILLENERKLEARRLSTKKSEFVDIISSEENKRDAKSKSFRKDDSEEPVRSYQMEVKTVEHHTDAKKSRRTEPDAEQSSTMRFDEKNTKSKRLEEHTHNRSSSRHTQDKSSCKHDENSRQVYRSRQVDDASFSPLSVDTSYSKKLTYDRNKVDSVSEKKAHDSKDHIGHKSSHKNDRHSMQQEQVGDEFKRSSKRLDRSSESGRNHEVSPVERNLSLHKMEKHQLDEVDRGSKSSKTEMNCRKESSRDYEQTNTAELMDARKIHANEGEISYRGKPSSADSRKTVASSGAPHHLASASNEARFDRHRHHLAEPSRSRTSDEAQSDRHRHHQGEFSKTRTSNKAQSSKQKCHQSSTLSEMQSDHRTEFLNEFTLHEGMSNEQGHNQANTVNEALLVEQRHCQTGISMASTSSSALSDLQRHHRADVSKSRTLTKDSSDQRQHEETDYHRASTTSTDGPHPAGQKKQHGVINSEKKHSINAKSQKPNSSRPDTAKAVTIAEGPPDLCYSTLSTDTSKTKLSTDVLSAQRKLHHVSESKSGSLTSALSDSSEHPLTDRVKTSTELSKSTSRLAKVARNKKPRKESSGNSVESSSTSSSSSSSSSSRTSSSSDNDSSSSSSSSSSSDSTSSDDDGKSYPKKTVRPRHSVKSLKNAKWVEVRKPIVHEIVTSFDKVLTKEDRRPAKAVGAYCISAIEATSVEIAKMVPTTSCSVDKTHASTTYNTEAEAKIKCERECTIRIISAETSSCDDVVRSELSSNLSRTEPITELVKVSIEPPQTDLGFTCIQLSNETKCSSSQAQKTVVAGKQVHSVDCKSNPDVYSPSAPTGWDNDDKPGNAPGWSSDSDIENPVAPKLPVSPPNSSLALSVTKTVVSSGCSEKTAPETSLGSVLQSYHVNTAGTSRLGGNTDLDHATNETTFSTTGYQFSCTTMPQMNISKILVELKSAEKGDKSVNADESYQVGNSACTDKTVASGITGCSDLRLGVSNSTGTVSDSTHMGVKNDKCDKSGPSSSPNRVEESDLEVSSTSKLAQSDSATVLTKSSISRSHHRELVSDTVRRRKDYSFHSGSQERDCRRSGRSRGSRSPSFDRFSNRNRRHRKSLRRSTSRDRQSSRKRSLSKSPSTRRGHGYRRRQDKKGKERSMSDSSDSDDVVIVEDNLLSIQNRSSGKQAAVEKLADQDGLCGTNEVHSGSIDLDTIPLPVLPDTIPLPVVSKTITFQSEPMPNAIISVKLSDVMPANSIEVANSSVLLSACAESTLSSIRKCIQGSDCLESVDMDLDNSDDYLQNVDLELNNSVDCSTNFGMVTDNVNHTVAQIQVAARSHVSSEKEDTVVSSLSLSDRQVATPSQIISNCHAGNDSRVSEKLLVRSQSQVADISSTTAESPRLAVEMLPGGQNLTQTAPKIVLSLSDSRKASVTDSQSSNSMWKRKLAINIIKPIKFNLTTAVGHVSSDEDDENDPSPVGKNFDMTVTTPESDTRNKLPNQWHPQVVDGDNDKTMAPVAPEAGSFEHPPSNTQVYVKSVSNRSAVPNNMTNKNGFASSEFLLNDMPVMRAVEQSICGFPVVGVQHLMSTDEIQQLPSSHLVDPPSTGQCQESRIVKTVSDQREHLNQPSFQISMQSPLASCTSSKSAIYSSESMSDKNRVVHEASTSVVDSLQLLSTGSRALDDNSISLCTSFKELPKSKQESRDSQNIVKTPDLDQRRSSRSRGRSRSLSETPRERLEKHASSSANGKQNSQDKPTPRDTRSISGSEQKSRGRRSRSPLKNPSRERHTRSPRTRKRQRSSSLSKRSRSPSDGSRQNEATSRKKCFAETQSARHRRSRSSSVKNDRYKDKIELASRASECSSRRPSNSGLDESKLVTLSGRRSFKEVQDQPLAPKRSRYSSIERDEHVNCDKSANKTEHKKLTVEQLRDKLISSELRSTSKSCYAQTYSHLGCRGDEASRSDQRDDNHKSEKSFARLHKSPESKREHSLMMSQDPTASKSSARNMTSSSRDDMGSNSDHVSHSGMDVDRCSMSRRASNVQGKAPVEDRTAFRGNDVNEYSKDYNQDNDQSLSNVDKRYKNSSPNDRSTISMRAETNVGIKSLACGETATTGDGSRSTGCPSTKRSDHSSYRCDDNLPVAACRKHSVSPNGKIVIVSQAGNVSDEDKRFIHDRNRSRSRFRSRSHSLEKDPLRSSQDQQEHATALQSARSDRQESISNDRRWSTTRVKRSKSKDRPFPVESRSPLCNRRSLSRGRRSRSVDGCAEKSSSQQQSSRLGQHADMFYRREESNCDKDLIGLSPDDRHKLGRFSDQAGRLCSTGRQQTQLLDDRVSKSSGKQLSPRGKDCQSQVSREDGSPDYGDRLHSDKPSHRSGFYNDRSLDYLVRKTSPAKQDSQSSRFRSPDDVNSLETSCMKSHSYSKEVRSPDSDSIVKSQKRLVSDRVPIGCANKYTVIDLAQSPRDAPVHKSDSKSPLRYNRQCRDGSTNYEYRFKPPLKQSVQSRDDKLPRSQSREDKSHDHPSNRESPAKTFSHHDSSPNREGRIKSPLGSYAKSWRGKSPSYSGRVMSPVRQHSRSRDGKSTAFGGGVMSPVRTPSQSRVGKSPDYFGGATSPVRRHSRSREDETSDYFRRAVSPSNRPTRSARGKSPDYRRSGTKSPTKHLSRARAGKSPDYGGREVSPLRRHSRHREVKSPDFGGRTASPMRRHSNSQAGKSSDYGGRAMSPLSRHSRSREGKSPDYGGRTASPVKHYSHSRSGKSPDYVGRVKSPVRHHFQPGRGRSPDYVGSNESPVQHYTRSGRGRSPGGKARSPVRRYEHLREIKSPSRNYRSKSPFNYHSHSSQNVLKGKSPKRVDSTKSQVRHNEQPRRETSSSQSMGRMSPQRFFSRPVEDKSPNRRSRLKSPVDLQPQSRINTSSQGGRIPSPVRYRSRTGGHKSPEAYLERKSPVRRHQSYYPGDKSHGSSKRLPSPRRRRSNSSNMDLSISPDHYGAMDVSPSMSISSLPDQDIVVNEALETAGNVRLSSGQLDAVAVYSATIPEQTSRIALYSDFVPPGLPQHRGTAYVSSAPFATFQPANSLPVYQDVAQSAGLNAPWCKSSGAVLSTSAEQLSGVSHNHNFNSYSCAWNVPNEPFSSDVVIVPGGLPAPTGVFSQSINQPPTNQYIVQPTNQFIPPIVNQVNPPSAGQSLAAACWPPHSGLKAAPNYHISQNNYQLSINSPLPPLVQQSEFTATMATDKGTSISIASGSSSIEVPPRKAPSPQWMPLPERNRDKFRSSSDNRGINKFGLGSKTHEAIIIKTEANAYQKFKSGENSGFDICCSKPGVGDQLATDMMAMEDPGCCCLWEAVPEVIVDVKSNSTGSDADVVEDRGARNRTKKRSGRHSESTPETAAASTRRRSSRFKSDDASQEESEKMQLKAEYESELNDGFIGSCDTYSSNDDCADGSKLVSGDVSNLLRPEKVKSRWRRWSELESDGTIPPPPPPPPVAPIKDDGELIDQAVKDTAEELENADEERPYFDEIMDNIFSSSRDTKKARKEARHMICDCTPPSPEELARGIQACGDDCLNRMLMIECSSRCPCGDMCTNKLFQKHQYAPVKCFKTDFKGWGLQAAEDLPAGKFIMEYVGEVLDPREFKSRIKRYARENYEHHYFMALNADEVIDATKRGNVSRFVNHCCDPNSETQKWTVNGELRIGFFTLKPVKAGEELTFDYQFETYGQEATKCYCGSSNCRGTIDVGRRSPFKKRSNKSKVKDIKKMPGMFSDIFLEEEIEKMSSMGGLRRKDDVLELNRLMLRAESMDHRISLLKALQDTKEQACLRLFLDYHGLALLWSWMVDVPSNDVSFKSRVLQTLKILPISNKTVLRDSRILAVVEKWAHHLAVESIAVATTECKARANDAMKHADVCGAESCAVDSQVTDDGLVIDEKANYKISFQSTEVDDTSNMAQSDAPVQTNDFPYVDIQTFSNSGVIESTSTKGDDTSERTDVVDKSSSQSIVDTIAELPLPGSGSVPHKKRHLLMSVETPSSSDGELAKTDEVASQDGEEGANAMTLTDNASICMSHDDDMTSVTEDEMTDRHSAPTVNDIARSLLLDWANLKEAYKIPKLFVEERKRTEQELDRRCEEHQSRKDSVLSWNRVTQRRLTDDSPDIKRRRRDDRGKLTESDEPKTPRMRNSKLVISTSPAIKPIQSTPPTLSKEERRQQFEAQVKAHDELMQQKNDLQLQQQQQPDSTFTDLFTVTPSGVSFTYADSTHYPVDASIGTYPVDPSLPMAAGSYGSDNMPLHLPVGGYGQELAMSGTMVQGGYLQDMTLSAPVTLDHVTNVSGITYCSQSDMAYYSGQPAAQYPQLAQSASTIITCDQMHQMSTAMTAHNYAQPSSIPSDSYSLVVDTLGQGQQYCTQTGMYYTVQGPSLLVQQPVYTSSASQIVHITPNRAPGAVSRDPRDPPPPPPSPPPKHKAVRLPPNWKTAKDASGKVYYYHSVTRQTQWDPPAWDANSIDEDDEDYMDLGTPTNDDGVRTSSNRRFTTTTAAADTSSEVAKRLKDNFRNQIAKHIVACLGPYRRPDCEQGRINTTEEFKALARKLSYAIMSKELKHCRHLEDLEVNENVKGKAKNYVVKYMSRFPGMYRASNYSP